MLSSCLTDCALDEDARGGLGFGLGFGGVGPDPISRNCPDELPCQVQDADLWFAETPVELEQAKTFCASCPARLACLSGAIEREEPWGVWGGEIFERGAIVARKRPRGRPRKSDREVAA
jgi:WhiB family transcriptional regulator, redox-sensing transcriptional regulator